MAEDKILKPKSFRIDEETAEKFKQVSGSIGGNQQETLAKLIEAYEFQQGKAVLTDKKEDIITFENYITLLTRMYMSNLEENQNITETVRGQYDGLLISKDTIIQELQSKINTDRQLKEATVHKSKELTDENILLNDRVTELSKMLIDKDNLNKALTTSCNDLRKTIEDSQEEMGQLKKISKEHNKVQIEYDNLLKEKNKLEDQITTQENTSTQAYEELRKKGTEALEQLEQKYNSNLENEKQLADVKLEKALLKLEKQFQLQINSINEIKQQEIDNFQDKINTFKESKQKEIDTYQNKYFELLEKLQEKDKKEGV